MIRHFALTVVHWPVDITFAVLEYYRRVLICWTLSRDRYTLRTILWITCSTWDRCKTGRSPLPCNIPAYSRQHRGVNFRSRLYNVFLKTFLAQKVKNYLYSMINSVRVNTLHVGNGSSGDDFTPCAMVGYLRMRGMPVTPPHCILSVLSFSVVLPVENPRRIDYLFLL